MTWEEQAREALRGAVQRHGILNLVGVLNVIRPIVEEEIERAHLSTQQAWMTAANLALPAEGQLDRVVEALYASAVEQAVEFKKRAEQAEAHADALIAAITVRGSWPAIREVLNAARQWKAERDD